MSQELRTAYNALSVAINAIDSSLPLRDNYPPGTTGDEKYLEAYTRISQMEQSLLTVQAELWKR
jgi:hypothetical protein